MDNEDFNDELRPRNWVQETRDTVAGPFDYVARISETICDTIWQVETACLRSPHWAIKILGGLGVIPALAMTTILTPTSYISKGVRYIVRDMGPQELKDACDELRAHPFIYAPPILVAGTFCAALYKYTKPAA